MRTARLLPVSPGMHCSRGVYLVLGGVTAQVLPPRSQGVGVCLIWGCLLPGGCLLLGGVCSQGVGVCLIRGVCSQGVSDLGCVSDLGGVCSRGVVSQHALRQTPPPDRITDACKNITLATTSLRPVNITLPQTSFAGDNNVTKHFLEAWLQHKMSPVS